METIIANAWDTAVFVAAVIIFTGLLVGIVSLLFGGIVQIFALILDHWSGKHIEKEE